MTDWDSKINEALAIKEKRDAEAATAKQAQADLSARHRQEVSEFSRDTLIPSLEQVRDMLQTPERGRDVEIRSPEPKRATIYVVDKNAPLPRPAELYVAFTLGAPSADPNHVHLTSEVGIGSSWLPMPAASGRLENLTNKTIVDALMGTWTKAVATGK